MSYKNKILVIDDELEIRTLLSRFLSKKGFVVLSAGNLKDGRKLLCDYNPEVVLIDVNLPDGNGLDELKYIHNSDCECKSSFIMMSAFDNQEVRQIALTHGAKDFLSKPFSLAKLDEVVTNQLN